MNKKMALYIIKDFFTLTPMCAIDFCTTITTTFYSINKKCSLYIGGRKN